MRSVRQHLSFANVVSLLALFLAIGGGAYAAATATKNSVTSKSVKNNSLKGVDVLDDSLSGQDVNEGSLDLPAGPPGPKGDKGDPGQNGQPDTPQQILDKIKTVDGPDSGLDADTFDGRQLCATEGTLTLDDDLPPGRRDLLQRGDDSSGLRFRRHQHNGYGHGDDRRGAVGGRVFVADSAGGHRRR